MRKRYSMVTAATVYAPNPGALAAIALAGLFCSVNLPSVSL
ncbi:MAG: hypothetical protein QM492_11910 [Rhodobacterales bacterium]